MYFLSTIFSAAGNLAHTVIWLYTWVVIISALLSWVNPDPYNPIVRTLRALTEPVFWRTRRLLPFTFVGGIDLSPVAVLLALQFVDYVLTRLLAYMAMQTMMP
jgi:YggT family protein